MLDDYLGLLPIFLIFGVIPLVLLVSFFRARRAGNLNQGHVFIPVDTLPAYNTNGSPMVPGSGLDVTGSPYGSESRF
jgi:hypothetical protein